MRHAIVTYKLYLTINGNIEFKRSLHAEHPCVQAILTANAAPFPENCEAVEQISDIMNCPTNVQFATSYSFAVRTISIRRK